MKLYIAEKPSLGRAIADALPKPHKKHDGYIEVANGDCVSWCIGHLLEQAEQKVSILMGNGERSVLTNFDNDME